MNKVTKLLLSVLHLHVDDGMLLVDAKDPEFAKARRSINDSFKIKHWKKLNDSVELPFRNAVEAYDRWFDCAHGSIHG